MKGVVIEVDIYSKIRLLYTQGISIRSIATRLGISRQTVKKYCEGNTHPDARKSYHREATVLTAEVRSFILACLRHDEEEKVTKQKHTAKRIYERLVSEKQFYGSYSAVRETVRELKAENMVPLVADMPLEYDPGEAIQIDWGEATTYIDNDKIKINLFCGRLCNSCDIFVQTYHAQNLESFLQAQQAMFDYFGGIPRRVIFDNAKVAVKEGFGAQARATPAYASFAAHYAFDTDFCNIASGNEKGLVENLVGYARRNFMVPVPHVSSIHALNQKLLEACLHYRNTHQVATRDTTVREAYEQERQFLQPIPAFRFDTSRTATPKVGDYSTVRFDRNNYSVPMRFLRKTVTVKGYAHEVRIYSEGREITSFDRLYGSGKTSYCLEHYLDLLERKPRSVFQAKPVRASVAKELLERGRFLPGGNAEMVRLLRLCVDHGEEKILSILQQLPQNVVATVDLVRSFIHESPEPKVLYLAQDIPITATDLKKYDQQCGVLQ